MRSITFVNVCVAVIGSSLVGCHAPTSPPSIVNPTPNDVLAYRVMWASHNLTNYSYIYEFQAFNAYAGHPIRLEVQGDTVRSAVLVETGQPIQPAVYFPTIDAMFDRALAAATNDSLEQISFDPALDYPVRMLFLANPDALSSVQASALQPLQ